MDRFEKWVDLLSDPTLRCKWQSLARFLKNRGFEEAPWPNRLIKGTLSIDYYTHDLFVDYYKGGFPLARTLNYDDIDYIMGVSINEDDPIGTLIYAIKNHSKELAEEFELDV
jgi:hypothetical protein